MQNGTKPTGVGKLLLQAIGLSSRRTGGGRGRSAESTVNVVHVLLSASNKPMHITELCLRGRCEGLLRTDPSQVTNSMTSSINSELEKGEQSLFVRTDRGTFSLSDKGKETSPMPVSQLSNIDSILDSVIPGSETEVGRPITYREAYQSFVDAQGLIDLAPYVTNYRPPVVPTSK